jgi:hypothetical protein
MSVHRLHALLWAVRSCFPPRLVTVKAAHLSARWLERSFWSSGCVLATCPTMYCLGKALFWSDIFTRKLRGSCSFGALILALALMGLGRSPSHRRLYRNALP